MYVSSAPKLRSLGPGCETQSRRHDISDYIVLIMTHRNRGGGGGGKKKQKTTAKSLKRNKILSFLQFTGTGVCTCVDKKADLHAQK